MLMEAHLKYVDFNSPIVGGKVCRTSTVRILLFWARLATNKGRRLWKRPDMCAATSDVLLWIASV